MCGVIKCKQSGITYSGHIFTTLCNWITLKLPKYSYDLYMNAYGGAVSYLSDDNFPDSAYRINRLWWREQNLLQTVTTFWLLKCTSNTYLNNWRINLPHLNRHIQVAYKVVVWGMIVSINTSIYFKLLSLQN